MEHKAFLHNIIVIFKYLRVIIIDTMGKVATTLDKQIDLLRSRGLEITCEKKAKECLLDIGYFRLCSYLFPFEKTYPKYRGRTHEVVHGTRFCDAVALYYFDFDLRNILNRYIGRIEVALRTYVTYTLSNKYIDDPRWFINPNVVKHSFIEEFGKVYEGILKICTSILYPLMTN